MNAVVLRAVPCLLLFHAVHSLTGNPEVDDQAPLSFAAWQRSKQPHFEKINAFKTIPELLMPVFNYSFNLPEAHLRRGSVYTGSNHRLRRVARNLLTGKHPVNFGLVGGSISWGQGASKPGQTNWFSVFAKYIQTAFPRANVTLRNGCVPATPSSFMVMCLERSVDPDVDVVFIEYLLNDGFEDSISNNRKVRISERLIRRIMGLPHHPAVVAMQVFGHGNAYDVNRTGWLPFHQTNEDVYGALAQYYDLQWLSLRTATQWLAHYKNGSTSRIHEFMRDDLLHPNDGGNKAMADLAVWLIQQTVMDLMLRPMSRADHDMWAEPLPVPMYPNNYEPTAPMCVHEDTLVPYVDSSIGWDYVNEGSDTKPKKGYVSREPGSFLKIRINTYRDGSDNAVQVFVAHLKSYDSMGIAKITCEASCNCTAVELDGRTEQHHSTTYLAVMHITQAQECVLSVEVLNKTNSGGHKFKVSGIMLAELDSGVGGVPLMQGHTWGDREDAAQWEEEWQAANAWSS